MELKKYRPNFLKEYIGQESVVNNIKMYIDYSKRTNTTMEHILLSGSSGLGKTTLANIIANELGNKITFIHGSSLNKISDILNIFSLISENEIIFIDEAHKIEKSIFETFYTIIEDYYIDINLGIENNKKSTRLKVPKFTLIIATNFIYKLPNAFIDRFPIKLNLKEYNLENIVEILINVCKNNDVNYNSEDVKYIASISRGNPRIAINYLKRYLTYLFLNITKEISIEKLFEQIGVYKSGILDQDLEYLKLLKEFKNLSLKSISQKLNIDENIILNNIEPYLVKIFFIEKNSKGRKLTNEGIKFLNQLEIR